MQKQFDSKTGIRSEFNQFKGFDLVIEINLECKNALKPHKSLFPGRFGVFWKFSKY